jgi:hydrophobic/amphiphilic exporter-1 (mainly G- bacteria), HAE1 family
VGEIRLVGGLKREIRVWVDPERMRAYGLSITDVANALRQQNLELPAGSVTQGANKLTVRRSSTKSRWRHAGRIP